VRKVGIDLYHRRNLAYADSLKVDAPNDGACSVRVPRGLLPGQYFLRITSAANSRVTADSTDFTVTCAGPTPAVSQVVVPQQWGTGQRQQVTWQSQGEVRKVGIDLYHRRNLAYADSLKVDAPNDGACSVRVPRGLLPGQYFLRITSAANDDVTADSTDFTIDDEHRERCVRYGMLLLGLPSSHRLPYTLIRRIAVAAAST